MAALVVVTALVLVGAIAVRGKESGRATPPPLPSAGQPARAIDGWITASASGIKDSSGQAVRLLGVADGRMNQCKPTVPKEEEATTLQRLGFNSVRLSFSWAATEPTPPTLAPDGTWQHHWDEGYLSKVDQAVSLFRKHGIAVILDLHQVRLSSLFPSRVAADDGDAPSRCPNVSLPAWVFAGFQPTQQQQAVCAFFTDTRAPAAVISPYAAVSAVWQQYAQRYAKNATVIAADVYNEPYVVAACPNVQRDNLARFYGVVGTAIRQVHPKITLIFEDVAYEGYTKHGLQLAALPALDNVIYSWHFYPRTWAEGKPGLAAHVERARALKVPLWLGEFDAFRGAKNQRGLEKHSKRGDNPNWQSDLAEMMAYCRSNGVSWALWEYRGLGSSLIDLRTRTPKEPLTRYLQSGF